MDKFTWLRPTKTNFDKIVQQDEDKAQFQRELGMFLGSCEVLYKDNPEKALKQLDWYYEFCRNRLMETPMNDTNGLTYFKALAELLVNFIQVFRAHHSLPPSDTINKDLREVRVVGIA